MRPRRARTAAALFGAFTLLCLADPAGAQGISVQGTGGTISFDGAGQQPGGIASGQPGGAAGGSGSAGSNLAAYLPTLT
ncbi:MAG: hypothetical protein ACREQ5_31370, partial [Candidatus Dormibacteria bacterium]